MSYLSKIRAALKRYAAPRWPSSLLIQGGTALGRRGIREKILKITVTLRLTSRSQIDRFHCP